jgi:hypothetical protein
MSTVEFTRSGTTCSNTDMLLLINTSPGGAISEVSNATGAKRMFCCAVHLCSDGPLRLRAIAYKTKSSSPCNGALVQSECKPLLAAKQRSIGAQRSRSSLVAVGDRVVRHLLHLFQDFVDVGADRAGQVSPCRTTVHLHRRSRGMQPCQTCSPTREHVCRHGNKPNTKSRAAWLPVRLHRNLEKGPGTDGAKYVLPQFTMR